MDQNCVLCGKEIQRGGFSSKIEGIVIRPLCANCDEKCSKEPKRVVDEYRDVFERMLTERREALAESIQTGETRQRSQRERTLVGRYADAYLVANGTVAIGKAIKGIGVALAVLIVVGMLLFTSQVKGDTALGPLLGGIVVGGVVGMFRYALGTLVATLGQALRACLDIAVNSSPFLANDLRAEIMSV